MQPRAASFSLSIVAAAAVFAAACLGACQGNGEGQRCSTNDDPGSTTIRGTGDCSGDLLCYPAADLGGVAASYVNSGDPDLGICCPPNRLANDPVTICASQGSPVGDAGSVLPDAGNETNETDANGGNETDAPLVSDAAGDAAPPPADASKDAPADAAPTDAPPG